MTGGQWELMLGDETTSCGSWLVSCTTLVKVSRCIQGNIQCPEIVSVSASESSCAMAVDDVLVHLSPNQDLLHMQTKHKVDDLSVLDGGYMVMGDSGGFLTIGVIHSSGDGSAKFFNKSSQKVVACDSNKGCAFKRVIFHLTDSGMGQVLALTSSGNLIVVSNIVLLDGDVNIRSAIVKTVSVPMETIDLVTCGEYFVLLGQGEKTISVYSMEDEQVILKDFTCQYEDAVMTHIWACGDMFFTMDAKGSLYLWNLMLLIVVDVLPLSDALEGRTAIDLRLIDSHKEDSIFSLKSVSAAVLSQDGLRMIQFPSMDCSFEQKAESNNALFLSESPISQDDIFVTQCHTDYDEDDEETTLSIKFMYYAVTDPERRLSKLLARKQFEEAQQLIRLYNMQFNITPHLVHNCMHDALPTLSETQELLRSCRKQIDGCQEKDDLVSGVSSELHELQYRFESFITVFGETAYSPVDWQKFQHADIMEKFINLLMTRKLHQAFDLWHCFQTELVTRLKPGMVGKILHSLTLNSPDFERVLDWLVMDIIPFLVWTDALTDEMTAILQWTLSAVTTMEARQTDWPMNAISFCDKMWKCFQVNILKPGDEETGLWNEKISASNDEELIQPLRDTLDCLKRLDELKNKFHCHLSFEVVRKETKDSLVYRMLDKVKIVESLPMILQTQILPYVEHNAIKADEIFASYVKDIMQRVSQRPYDNSSWTSKVKAIIEVIQAPKDKVMSVLNLVENSHLPFADFVEELVESVLESVKHPLTATLQSRWQTLQASNLLTLYGWEPYSVTPSKALAVARYFILQDKPSSMTDARTLLRAVGVEDEVALAQYQAMYYIDTDRLPDLISYLKSLPLVTAKTCAKWCLGLGEMNMTSFRHPQTAMEQAEKKSRLRFLSAGILCADLIKYQLELEDPLELEEVEKIYRKLHTARILEKDYDIGVGRFDLDDKEKCIDILKAHIIGTQKEITVLRIAELLGIGRETALCYMTEHAASEGLQETVYRLAQTVSECPNYDKSSCSYDTAMKLVGLEQTSLLVPAKTLATHALLTCRSGEIQSRLELTRQISLLENMSCHIQEESDGGRDLAMTLGLDSGRTEKDMAEWLETRYSEMKMPLDENLMVQTYKVMTVANQDLNPVTLSEVRSVLTELISNLSSNGHDGLTLGILNHVQHKTKRWTQENENEMAKGLINKAIHKVSSRMLGKVMKQSCVDRQLCLTLVLQLPQRQVLSLIDQETNVSATASVNHTRLKKIHEVLVAYGELHGDMGMVSQCQELNRQEKWRNRLAKIGLSLGPKPSKKTILHVVSSIMLDSNTSFQLVQEFALDMGLDMTVVEKEYQSIFHQVLAQAPVSPNALEKASSILQCVTDESSRLTIIKDALAKTNEYNYEVLQFLMEQWDLMEDSKTILKSMELLKLVKAYQRHCPPGEVEEEATSTGHSSDAISSGLWTTNSAVMMAAKMAAWERQQQLNRLPFRLLQGKNIGKIMGPELTPSTLPSWLLITSALGTPKDQILIRLVSNMISSYIKSAAATGDSQSGPLPVDDDGVISAEFEALLQEIGPILLQVDRMDCAIWFCQASTDKLTKVGEKVKALENGLSFAKKWLEISDQPEDESKAEKAVKMFSSKLPPLSTHWSLIRAGLGAKEELKPFVNQPELLIRQLYHLPLKTMGTIDDVAFDETAIHTACEEIAEIHDLDLLAIQTALIDLWLTGSDSFSSNSNDADQTMFNVTTDFDIGCDTKESLPRILSMLRCFNGPSHFQHLMELLSTDEGCLSLNSRQMAIMCLFETGHADHEMRQELKLLNQLIGLQSLGVNYTPEMFSRINKVPLLLRLWERYRNQEKAVPLIASLCLDQRLTTPELWNSILSQMIKFDQKNNLRPLMMKLINVKGMEQLRRTDGYIRAKTLQF